MSRRGTQGKKVHAGTNWRWPKGDEVNLMPNECKAGHYKTNIVIVRTPLVCFGNDYLGQPQCPYFKGCAEEVIKPILTAIKWRNFQRKNIKQ